MKHSKNPIKEIFKTLETYLINPHNAAHILRLSEATADNWFYKYTTPNQTNYQRLRFLCYVVQDPIRVATATIKLYKQKDKLKNMMAKVIPFSRVNTLIHSANTLQTMNHLIHHSVQLDYNIPLEIQTFIRQERKKLFNSIYLMYKVSFRGNIQNYSLQLLQLLDREIEIPTGYKYNTYENGRPPELKKVI